MQTSGPWPGSLSQGSSKTLKRSSEPKKPKPLHLLHGTDPIGRLSYPPPSPCQHNSPKRLCSVKHLRHLPRTSSWCQLSRTSLAIIGCAAYRPNHYQLIPRPRACRTFTRFIFKQHRSAQETCWANFLICGEVKRFRSCYRRSSRRFGSLP